MGDDNVDELRTAWESAGEKQDLSREVRRFAGQFEYARRKGRKETATLRLRELHRISGELLADYERGLQLGWAREPERVCLRTGCERTLTGRSDQLTCSDECRTAMSRENRGMRVQRKNPVTIRYECPECGGPHSRADHA
jgi:hypothetical protein